MTYRLEIWQRNDLQWLWHVKRKGKIVCQGEAYKRRGDMLRMLSRLFAGTGIEDQVSHEILVARG